MKTKRLCSLVLVVVMLMNFSIPIAHAAGAGDISSSESAIIVEGQSYLAHGEEDSEKRFNIIINAETREGQFAVVYLDEPDYLYEHFFNMEDLQNAGVDMDWTDVEEFCFAQETEWNEIYIPTAVTCIKYPDNSIMQEGEGGIAPATVNATGDDPIEYFEGWLEEQHGSEYSGQPVSSKTQNGTTMHLKSAFQTYVYRNQTFLFSVAVSVAGFITGFLGSHCKCY